MAEFAEELSAWLEPEAGAPHLPGLEEIAARIKAAHEVAARRGSLRTERIGAAERMLAEFEPVLRAIGETLAASGISEGHLSSNNEIFRFVEDRKAVADLIWVGGRVIAIGGMPWMYISAAVAVYDNGKFRLIAGYLLGSRSGQNRISQEQLLWHSYEDHPIGSASARSAVKRLGAGLLDNFEEAMKRYSEELSL